jgi:hypothetical protein
MASRSTGRARPSSDSADGSPRLGWHGVRCATIIGGVDLPDDRAVDVVTTGSAGFRRRWSATSVRRRIALVGATMIAAAAVVVGAAAGNASPLHQVRTVVDPGPPAAVTGDAAGCPVTVQCTTSATPPRQLQAALVRAFPMARVVSGDRTTEVGGRGLIYHATIVGALDGGAVVSATAQCVPRGAAVVEQTVRSANTSLDLAGNTVVHARLLSEIVPDAVAGCSVQVYLDSPGVGTSWDAAAISLAHDPAAQVAPR